MRISDWSSDVCSSDLTALVKSDRFEAIHLVVPAGSTIPPHHVAGYLTLHCLEGRVTLGPTNIALGAGDWVYLERGDQHSVQGIEDARLLLTILDRKSTRLNSSH